MSYPENLQVNYQILWTLLLRPRSTRAITGESFVKGAVLDDNFGRAPVLHRGGYIYVMIRRFLTYSVGLSFWGDGFCPYQYDIIKTII